MNRRYFIGTALAAAAASRTRGVAASDQVNVGIIGVGGRGRSLIGEVRQVPGANIRYLCDADQALSPEMFDHLMRRVRALCAFAEKDMP